jgi:hypothetical protein
MASRSSCVGSRSSGRRKTETLGNWGLLEASIFGKYLTHHVIRNHPFGEVLVGVGLAAGTLLGHASGDTNRKPSITT